MKYHNVVPMSSNYQTLQKGVEKPRGHPRIMLRGRIILKGLAGKASKKMRVGNLWNDLPWFYKNFQAKKV